MNTERISCDVLVAGGGSAGLAAAIAAARKGASVVLLEKNSFLGGKATAAYVGTICGLYYTSDDPTARYVSDGFATEFAERLRILSSTKPQHNKLGLHYLPYQPFDFKLLCDQYIREEKIQIFFHSVVSNVSVEQQKIQTVQAICYDRPVIFKPAAVVDCTGEATVTLLAGAPISEQEEYQASAQVFSMEGVEAASEANLSMIILKEIQLAIAEGILPADHANVSIVPGSLREKQVYLKIGIPEKIKNELNKISPVELTARKMIMTVTALLQTTTNAFKYAHIGDIAPEAGIRTGRRGSGVYTLTKEEVLSCKKDPDSAARGSWPIEFWEIGKRVKMDFFEKENYYDIPKNCLRSSSVPNLFFAGRNLSATEDAIASARVIGTCLQTGFTAGEMASQNYKL
ncbi:MAG TPA: FAD-dependent oxidoreductase [Cytophagaceae bacterium]|nr:FAD-dependent oxidoreductase [Cytophagaceae bacterium]